MFSDMYVHKEWGVEDRPTEARRGGALCLQRRPVGGLRRYPDDQKQGKLYFSPIPFTDCGEIQWVCNTCFLLSERKFNFDLRRCGFYFIHLFKIHRFTMHFRDVINNRCTRKVTQ